MKASKRRRHLIEFIKGLKHAMHVNDDIIPESNKEKLNAILAEAEAIDYHDAEKTELFLIRDEKLIERLLPKRTSPQIREYADIFAVALVVAFGIRAMFFQPFKIPTSSMQPTLFGIHYIDNKDLDKHSNVPPALRPIINMDQRAHAVIETDGYLVTGSIQEFTKYKFFKMTRFQIGKTVYELPGEAKQVFTYIDYPGKKEGNPLIPDRTYFGKGTVLCDGWMSTGDHLFVNRFTHYFTGLERGDVIVFNTEDIYGSDGIELTKKGYFYIKRLVAVPGDEVEIRDNVLYVKPAGATQARPVHEYAERLKKIYSGKGGYHGHLNQETDGNGAPSFLGRENQKKIVPEGYYLAFGDNSANSSDGRSWGLVPRKNIVGKAFNVFWPFSRRWGLVDSQEPLEVPTNLHAQLPAMQLQ